MMRSFSTLALAFAVLVILRWAMDAAAVSDLMVALMIVAKVAAFLPVGVAVAVLENRANHRVRPFVPLYRERGRENGEDVT